jgi:hypothetical protein
MMPSRIASIIGLKIDMPGSRRRAKAKPAMPEVSAKPGSSSTIFENGLSGLPAGGQARGGERATEVEMDI